MSAIAPTQSPLHRVRPVTLVIFAGLLLALVLPAQALASVDLRLPDTRDASAASVVDVRSPDARDAARTARQAPGVDLRSPDARDVGRSVSSAGHSSVLPAPASHGDSSGTSAWIYLALGGVALVMVGALTVTSLRRRRRGASPSVALRGGSPGPV